MALQDYEFAEELRHDTRELIETESDENLIYRFDELMLEYGFDGDPCELLASLY